MKIPETLRINGRDYKTKSEERLNNGSVLAYGHCNWETGEIILEPNLQDHEGQCITYWHEILHILLHNAGIEFDKPNEEEDIVIALSQGIYQVLQDNGAKLFDLK